MLVTSLSIFLGLATSVLAQDATLVTSVDLGPTPTLDPQDPTLASGQTGLEDDPVTTLGAVDPSLTPPPGPAPTDIPLAVTSTFPAVPLVDKHFDYPSGIPYRVDTDDNLARGRQTGFNICNSTTQNQDSLCQTSFVNSIDGKFQTYFLAFDDFCIWGPPDPNSVVASTEGEMVAWCTNPNHGTRLIPKDSLTGVQFMRTPDYVQVVGYINQSRINLQSDDYGGEMDPHGADWRGNPLGGLMYSNAWSNGNNNSYTQVIEWHDFIGSNYFCVKVCDPAGPNDANFCQHIYDRMGCAYNAPSNAQNGTFESCLGDDQDYPGVYTDASGAVVTYSQPPESLGPITSFPYTPRVPASSQCTTYESSVIYKALENVTVPGDPTSTSASPSITSGSTRRPTAAGPTATGAGMRTGASVMAVVISFVGLGLLVA
ncbi:hypothetical protein H0H92_012035 [Tricholoma furcatifolium]|nr:hypothetical protein H0H92_012035 [Tricholoma furcatifolium]